MKSLKDSLPLSLIVAAIIVGGALIFINQGPGTTTEALSSQEAADKAIDFINRNMLPEGMTASLLDVAEESGLYKLKLQIEDDEVDSYISLDGKVFFVQGIDMDEIDAANEVENTPQEVGKTDVPDVKLFVMSYCPYGLQAQKALLPAYDLLKDKADIGIYFVSYIMHGMEEIDENMRQYCIQKEQESKLSAYLSCFVKDGESDKCLSEAGVDQGKMESCISVADGEFKVTENYNDKSSWLNGRYPKFDVHAGLNDQYGVSGSPTFVINGEKISVASRSPEEFKKAICQAFNVAPDECSQTLSTDAASPGLGDSIGGSSGGSCE